VKDVEDCCAAAQYLEKQQLVDGLKMAIDGGSAGGYTTLSALAFKDVREYASYVYVSVYLLMETVPAEPRLSLHLHLRMYVCKRKGEHMYVCVSVPIDSGSADGYTTLSAFTFKDVGVSVCLYVCVSVAYV